MKNKSSFVVVMLSAFIMAISSLLVIPLNAEFTFASSTHRTPLIFVPTAPQTQVVSASGCELDYSNAAYGYVMVKYTGPHELVLIELLHEEAPTNFKIHSSESYTCLPLSHGNGIYHIRFYEPALYAGTDEYSELFQTELFVELQDEFMPFLYPNQMVWFSAQSQAVQFGAELLDSSMSDAEVITAIFNYVTENISADYQLESEILNGIIEERLILDIDSIYLEQSGVCLDSAVLMTALLRSQQIPAKLVFGYANTDWHAWVSVYTPEGGWVSYDPAFMAASSHDDPPTDKTTESVSNVAIVYREVLIF